MNHAVSTTRLYGGVIAVVSGLYSALLAGLGPGMAGADWLMAALGVVVLTHGVVLFTDVADRLGSASGPLMVAYAVLMLLGQGWMAAGSSMGDGMDGGMGDGMSATAMGADAGMVALAVVMLGSGLVMTARGDEM